MKPDHYSKNLILPVPRHFVIMRFHCGTIINCPLITVKHSKTYGRNIFGLYLCAKEKANQV